MNKVIIIITFLVIGFYNSQQPSRTYNISSWKHENGSLRENKKLFDSTTISIDDHNKNVIIQSSQQNIKLKIDSEISDNTDLNGDRYKEMIIKSDQQISGVLRLYDDDKKGCILILKDSKWYYNN